MTTHQFGIRGRINIALGCIICLATIAFGTAYALVERNSILDSERAHLHHLAALAKTRIARANDQADLEAILADFEMGLSEATDVEHHLTVELVDGSVISPSTGNAPGFSNPTTSASRESALLGFLLPEFLEVSTPIHFDRYTSSRPGLQPRELLLTEPLDGLRKKVYTSLLRHFLFAGGLVTLTMLFVGAIVHRLVVRPISELASATERIARDGDWDPIHPTTRRNDEIGMLADRIATMSRRLVPAVRSERYGSAHLVAERVRRELDEPLRRVRIQLEMLKGIATEPDEARACDEIGMALQEIAEIGRRLGEIHPAPPV